MKNNRKYQKTCSNTSKRVQNLFILMIEQNDDISQLKPQENDNIDVAIEEENRQGQFPGFTHWEKSKFCCFPTKYIPSVRAHFWGEWEVDICMPLFVIITMISSYGIYVWAMLTNDIDKKLVYYFLIPVMTLLFILFFTSYINIIKTGPGYYPFYYSQRESIQNPPDVFLLNQECTMSGIISNQDQYNFCYYGNMPPRSILAKSARRIVMKPDHLCGWTATWIGKKNFKMFILFNIYGALYCGIYLGTGWMPIRSFFSPETSLTFSGGFIAFMLFFAFNFFCFTMSFSYSSISSLIKNQTSWESWNNIDPKMFDEGVINNCKDSCGDNYCLWPCPTAPFSQKRNDELMSKYKFYPRNLNNNRARSDD